MDDISLSLFDTVEVTGLSVILDEAELPPFLQLRLGCGERTYRAAILAVEDDWALNIRDEDGVTLFDEGDLYPTQSSAILGAMLSVLAAARTPSE